MITLIDKLQSAGIPHEVTVQTEFNNALHICYPSQKHRACSVICNEYSYGGKEGLLEIWGLADRFADVQGWLTANDVFTRIYTHYINSAD